MRSILDRRHLLVVMPTGSGKSLLYQLPALMDDGLTLVVSPLIALMKDQVDELEKKGLPAGFVNSSLSLEDQRARLTACAQGRVRLLYVAPERFRNAAFLSMLDRVKIARLAVDEAHCISEWGHDFRPDYLRLKNFRKKMGDPLTTALTATATVRVQGDIIEALGLEQGQVDVHVQGFDRPNLALSVVRAFDKHEKEDFLLKFLDQHPGAGIIYTGTRKLAEEMGTSLKLAEPRITVYHAGMEPEARSAAQEKFLSGRSRIVVATNAFGMGIDKPDVRFVVHYHYPGSVEQYYQEIGRAGRDGQPSECALLHSPADHFLREYFIDLNHPGPDLVKIVYEKLFELPANPVMLTYKQIADLCGEGIKDGQVGSAVRLLDETGLTRAFTGEPRVAVVLSKPAAEILPEVKGPSQRRTLEALSASVDLERPGRCEVGLYELARDAALSEDQVRRALLALDHAGLLSYEPPFRGRGVEKLAEKPPPFAEVPIDWERQDKLRRLEFDKLEAMEDYIHSSACRRGLILRYFGEEKSYQCGTCDNCAGAGTAARGRGRKKRAEKKKARPQSESPEPAEDEVHLACLECVEQAPTRLGRNKLAAILTGSRAKWIEPMGAHRLPVYGALRLPRERVLQELDRLIKKRLLKKNRDLEYPVIELTERGRGELKRMRAAAAQKPKPVPETSGTDEEPARPSDRTPAPATPLVALNELLDRLISAEAEEAKSLLPVLAAYHPREIANRIESIFRQSRDLRSRSRAVWAMGELAGRRGLAFLIETAGSKEQNLRRLSASALGKVFGAIAAEDEGLSLQLDQARAALEKLRGDPALQVRQYAEKSLAEWEGEKAKPSGR